MLEKMDYKKEFKDLYQPKQKPMMIEVPAMQFIMVDGKIRRHHEIYMGDPRKIEPEKMKTVLRYPVKNKIV